MKNKLFLIFLFLTTILYSCKKELSGSGAALNKTLNLQDLDFEFLNTKSRIKYTDKESNISATATIRIKKDSIIWISLSPAFGIEAARGIITRDSLKFINRLNKEYMIYDFEGLSNKFNFKITFDLIQSMLLGEMPKETSEEDIIIQRDDHFLIRQTEGPISIDNYITAGLMKLEKVQMAETPSQNTLTLLYEDFQNLEENFFPYKSLISLNYRSGSDIVTTQINIDHGRAEINSKSLSFPFNIPQKYERK